MRGPGKCRPIAPRRAVLLPTTSTLTSASTGKPGRGAG
uniref:THAP domain containing, apoptosis associated protein 2 n=1 Tax=Mus musculus TaxID=10090 RepID=A0A1W2P852_MOUSE